jgi:hypothetical protein
MFWRINSPSISLCFYMYGLVNLLSGLSFLGLATIFFRNLLIYSSLVLRAIWILLLLQQDLGSWKRKYCLMEMGPLGAKLHTSLCAEYWQNQNTTSTSMCSTVKFEFMEMIRCLLRYSFMRLSNHGHDATSFLRKKSWYNFGSTSLDVLSALLWGKGCL